MELRVDSVSAMQHGETKVFEFIRNGRPAQGFLLRYHQGYYAYLNQCCHWPVPLDMGEGEFYYADIDRILCKTHGAVYAPETGICDYGPCVHAKLDSFPLILKEDYILISLPE